MSRCLLLTDGLANHGITDRDELARHAHELRVRGVVTSTIGVGADFDERLLRDMAHEGGGTFYFAEGASQIPGMLTSELGEAAEVTVRDASVTVEVPRGARVEVLNRFRSETNPATRAVTVQLGDLVSDQEITVVLSVTFPKGEAGEQLSVRVAASEREHVRGAERDLRWTFAGHADNDAQPRERAVDRAVATVFAARARAEATEANRHHDFATARRVLERTATRIRSYAAGDTEITEVARSLELSVPEYGEAEMSPATLKANFFVQENALKSRMQSGRVGRRQP